MWGRMTNQCNLRICELVPFQQGSGVIRVHPCNPWSISHQTSTRGVVGVMPFSSLHPLPPSPSWRTTDEPSWRTYGFWRHSAEARRVPTYQVHRRTLPLFHKGQVLCVMIHRLFFISTHSDPVTAGCPPFFRTSLTCDLLVAPSRRAVAQRAKAEACGLASEFSGTLQMDSEFPHATVATVAKMRGAASPEMPRSPAQSPPFSEGAGSWCDAVAKQ